MKKQLLAGLTALVISGVAQGQTLNPIAVTGFVHDGIAETYPNSLASTDTVLDASAYVMYSQAFAAGGSYAGGLPNNGLITAASGTRVFQLQPYTGNNIINVMRNVNRAFTLTTPASYQKLSLLCFSTEGTGTLKVTLEYADGTQAIAIASLAIPDWFSTSATTAVTGMGRVTRTATVTAVDGPTTNPKMFYVDFSIPCAERPKLISKVWVTNITTGGTNAPYPNIVCLALSGQDFTQTSSSSFTNAACGTNNGTATFNISGNTAPYTLSWNTPAGATTATVTNLAPGNYTATATDATGCVYTKSFTIAMAAAPTVTASASPANVCPGNPSMLSVSSSNATALATYNWSPGGATSPTVNVTPTVATNYTVTGVDVNGCAYSATTSVGMNALPSQPTVTGGLGCLGGTATFNVSNPVTGATYNWYNVATGGQIQNTGSSYNVSNLANGNTYYVTATVNGCTSTRQPATVSLYPQPVPNAGPDMTIITGDQVQIMASSTPGTYLWTPSTGLSATNVLQPMASPTVTTTYTLKTTTANGCSATDDMIITVLPYCIHPMEAFTPNGDGINDFWKVTDGNCTRSSVVRVYNRYGHEVYGSDNYANNWNGMYNGKPLPDGTYYFVITYQLINGKKAYMKGNVTILR